MREVVVVVTAGVSSLLTTIWHHAIHRHREIRSHRAMCNHQWGEPVEVALGLLGGAPHYYKSFCPACGEQKNVNRDGSDYIPTQERREEDWID